MDFEVYVPEHRRDRLDQKLSQLARRASKLETPPIVFEWLNTPPVWRNMVVQHKDMVDETIPIRCYALRVSGQAPVLSGYRFLARLEHLGSGNLVYGISSGGIDPKWRTCEPECSHCCTDRSRKETYLLEDTESGNVRQIGSTCLKDFLGHPDPIVVAQIAALLTEFEKEEVYGGEELGVFDPEMSGHTPRHILAVSNAVIRQEGKFVSVSSASRMETTTSDLVKSVLYSRSSSKIDVISSDYALADKILSWLDECEDTSAYLGNLQIIARERMLGAEHVATLCSAPYAFSRALSAPKAQERTQYVGQPGEKAEALVTYKGKASFGSKFGTQHLCFFETQAARLVWKTSNVPLGLVPNESYTMIATVKEHGNYKGEPQTVITKPKFLELELIPIHDLLELRKFQIILADILRISGSVATLNVTQLNTGLPALQSVAHSRPHIEELLQAGVDANALDAQGYCHILAFVEDQETIDILLAYGADPKFLKESERNYLPAELKARYFGEKLRAEFKL